MKILFKYYLLLLTILFLSCEQNNTVASIDCAGVVGGLFEIDECGDCNDPYTSDWNGGCTDCSGILNGKAQYDPCGQCICSPDDYPQGPPSDSLCKYPLECSGMFENCFLMSSESDCNSTMSCKWFDENDSSWLEGNGIEACIEENCSYGNRSSCISTIFCSWDYDSSSCIENPACSDGIASYNDGEKFYIGADVYGEPIYGSFDNITFYTIPCTRDCNEQFGGNAYEDECNICVLDGQSPSVDTDNDGECDGIDYDGDGFCDKINGDDCDCAFGNCDSCIDHNIDHCGECNGDGVDVDFSFNTLNGGIEESECNDLNGIWHSSDSWYDTSTGKTYAPCGDGECDGSDADDDGQCDRDINSSCDGEDTCLWDDFVPYDNNCGDCDGIVDECQICNGIGVDADNDGLCDNLDLDNNGGLDDSCLAGQGTNGTGIIDECGVCGGEGIPEDECDCNSINGNPPTPHYEDCIGICGGNALIDDCGLCYNYNIMIDGNPTFISPQVDYDNDGICDGTDADGDGQCDEENGSCDGADDCIDLDNDGICGSLDNCQNDPYNDADSDGICGDVDLCNGDNSSEDTDSDGICGNLDQCEGFDDNIDTDSDGIADGCDACPNDADNDADSDGVCGDVDDCPYDADNDEDLDGICGDVDLCSGDNSSEDTDSDGICNDLDDDDDDDGVTDENDCSPEDSTLSISDCLGQCGGNAILDCSNTCNGPATIDQCGICSGYSTTIDNIPTTIHPSVDVDFSFDATNNGIEETECNDLNGIWYSNDSFTEEETGITYAPCGDGVCDGTDADGDYNCDQDQNGDCDGEDTCIGNNFDECGICNGSGVDLDTDGICDTIDGCVGSLDFSDHIYDINGNNVGDPLLGGYDICGICHGIGVDIDNDGLCDNDDVNGDGFIDDSCIDTDDDAICDHNDDCLDIDNDDVCDDADDCVGSFDQCGDCNGDGTSCLVNNGCDLDPDTIYIHDNSEIWYNLSFDINDFSLSLTNNSIVQVSGGSFESNGLQDNITSGVLFIYSGTIPAGCGTLFNLTVSDDSEDITIDEFLFNGGGNTATYCDTCIYEFQDPCDAYTTLSTNSISLLYDGTVIYNIDFDLNQFEWTVDNATSINSVSGGSSEDAGFDFQTVGNILYAFANGTAISAGCGELTQMTLDEYNNISLSNIIFKDVSDNIINITYIEANDCQDTVDECGVCGGNGIPDGDCDCYGNVLDECGVCDGPGIAEGTCDCDGNIDADGDGVCDTTDFDASTMPINSIAIDDIGNVYYNVNFDIGGFEWDVEGATIVSASGGDAAANGFTVSNSETKILGFSFTGSSVPAGNGILTQMVLDGNLTAFTGIIFSSSAGESEVVTYYTIP